MITVQHFKALSAPPPPQYCNHPRKPPCVQFMQYRRRNYDDYKILR